MVRMESLQHLKKKQYLIKIRSPKHVWMTSKALFSRPKYAFFGSFDPFTWGHLEVYKCAQKAYSEQIDFVIVKSLFKCSPTFSLQEREKIMRSYLPDANIYFARDYHEIKKLKHKSVKIIKGKRNHEDEEHTNFIFDFYGISMEKLHQIETDVRHRKISSSKLKELVSANRLETAKQHANDFTIHMLRQALRP